MASKIDSYQDFFQEIRQGGRNLPMKNMCVWGGGGGASQKHYRI